jgi:hypothetical protein
MLCPKEKGHMQEGNCKPWNLRRPSERQGREVAVEEEVLAWREQDRNPREVGSERSDWKRADDRKKCVHISLRATGLEDQQRN